MILHAKRASSNPRCACALTMRVWKCGFCGCCGMRTSSKQSCGKPRSLLGRTSLRWNRAGVAGFAFCASTWLLARARAGSATCRRRPASTLMPEGKLVPAAQLGKRDAEAVGDGDQGVAPAGGVVDRCAPMGRRTGATGTTSASTPSSFASRSSSLAAASWPSRYAIGARHRSQGVVRRDLVIAPGVALALGNGGDASPRREGRCPPAGADRTWRRAASPGAAGWGSGPSARRPARPPGRRPDAGRRSS